MWNTELTHKKDWPLLVEDGEVKLRLPAEIERNSYLSASKAVIWVPQVQEIEFGQPEWEWMGFLPQPFSKSQPNQYLNFSHVGPWAETGLLTCETGREKMSGVLSCYVHANLFQ